MNHIIEDMNYYNDRRVVGVFKWYKSLDEKRMKATIDRECFEGIDCPHDAKCSAGFEPPKGFDCDKITRREVEVRFEICPICNGKGSHVNPSIDCNGLTSEDFDEDPEFARDYMSGAYDVPCNGCRGRRVVPVPTDPEVLAMIAEDAAEDAAYRAEVMAERRMGA